jgi:hypothetical protein
MKDFVDLGGTTPPMEECAQVGSREYDYYDRARKECRAYINQLRRVVGAEPEGARFSIKSHPHDFGNYLTVVVYFDSDNEAARQYAIRCDEGTPKEWDDAAKQELQHERR